MQIPAWIHLRWDNFGDRLLGLANLGITVATYLAAGLLGLVAELSGG